MPAKHVKIVMVFFVVFIFLFVSISVHASEIIVRAGTPVAVKMEDTISSETSTAGESVRFTVTRNVDVDGVVVIKAGSHVIAEVTYVEKSGSLGKEGKIGLMVRYAQAVDGTRIPLRATLSQHGDEKVALSYVLCPFIKGTSTMIKAGTETKAYVDYDTKININ